MILTKGEARRITALALKAARAPEVEVRVRASRTGNIRFANNQATTSGDVDRLTVTVTVSEGGRSAATTGNRVDAEGVRALVHKAEELCRLSPVDPEHTPPLAAQSYLKVAAHDRKTAGLNAEGRANLAAKMIRVGNLRKLVAAGLVTTHESADAIANRAGLFAYTPTTGASVTATLRTRDGTGSGWAGDTSHRVDSLDPEAVALAAADKAEMSQGPQALEPGRHVVVLEPQAVSDLLGFLVGSLRARPADEGRSYFSKPGGGTRVGESLFHRLVTLRSDPGDKDNPSSSVGPDGVALRPTTWIEGGVLKQLSYSRFWARKQQKPEVPGARSVFLNGSDTPLTELIRGVARGVLVTRFWYNRMLEPRTILATGLTRDGTFLIEDGRVARPIKNMRYNESPVTILKNLLAVGVPQRVVDERVSVVPPLVVHDFNFASVSDAV